VCARLHLRPRIGFDPCEVTRSHLGGENLSPRGIDALAMMTKGRLKPMTTSLVAELITVSVMMRSCEKP